jgi:RNA-directed DNA polymerase
VPFPSADSAPFGFHELVQAYLDCRRHKRNTASAQRFEARLERNLVDLHDELCSGQYRPGRSICFVVTRPKVREVWAADFRDRIVHHLLYNHIAPRFIARFDAGSSACIPGRGTLYAAKRVEAGVRAVSQNWSRPAWYLKMDLANFFVAIDKRILLAQLTRHVPESWWLQLTETILMHDPRTDVDVRGSTQVLAKVPPHKSLFNAPADTGLPIGNLSSQFFANVHLNDLDQFVKQQVRARHYTRYVDDFLLVHEDPQWLNAARLRIEAWLPEHLGARVNPRKTILQPVARGVDMVGQVIKPWRRITRRRTMHQALQRLEATPAEQLHQVGNSYLGLVRQSGHSHHDQALIARLLLDRGHAVSGDLCKTFRRPQ